MLGNSSFTKYSLTKTICAISLGEDVFFNLLFPWRTGDGMDPMQEVPWPLCVSLHQLRTRSVCYADVFQRWPVCCVYTSSVTQSSGCFRPHSDVNESLQRKCWHSLARSSVWFGRNLCVIPDVDAVPTSAGGKCVALTFLPFPKDIFECRHASQWELKSKAPVWVPAVHYRAQISIPLYAGSSSLLHFSVLKFNVNCGRMSIVGESHGDTEAERKHWL